MIAADRCDGRPRGVVSALTAALLLASVAAGAGEGIDWHRDFDRALALARSTGKPMIVDFWADWCGWCHRLDETTWIDSEVVRLSRAFVAVRVDTEAGPEAVEVAVRYNVAVLPTIAFLSPEGHQLRKITAYQGPGKFPETMREALELAERVGTWERTLAEGKADPEPLAELGAHLFYQEFYDESLELLSRAAQIDAGRPADERKLTRLLLGVVLSYDRRYDEAEQQLQDALALKPASKHDPHLLLVLGRTYLRAGRPRTAARLLREVLEKHPDSDVAERADRTLRFIERRYER